MAVRIRKVGNHVIAVCAANTYPKEGDTYIRDEHDRALRIKYLKDYASEGLIEKRHIGVGRDQIMIDLMDHEESFGEVKP